MGTKGPGQESTVDAPQPREGAPERFVVTFRLFPPQYNKARKYTVCTVLGAQKALALASLVHGREHPKEAIYDVVEVRSVGAGGPEDPDLLDRMEGP
jgi:hypothetical protein